MHSIPRQPEVARGRMLEVVGLFAGIGGLELGLHQTGHSTKMLCEIDAAAHARRRRQPTLDRGRDLHAGPGAGEPAAAVGAVAVCDERGGGERAGAGAAV